MTCVFSKVKLCVFLLFELSPLLGNVEENLVCLTLPVRFFQTNVLVDKEKLYVI